MASDYDDDQPHGWNGAWLTTRLVTVGAISVVALCVAFLIGYSAHRGVRAEHDAAAKAAPQPSGPISPAPVTASSSPNSSPTFPRAVTRQPLTRNSAGVIVGYSHDRQGAVAAAGNYTAAMYVQTNRTHARELTVLTSIAATAADATRMVGDFASEDGALAKLLDVATLQASGVIAYGHPLGYRVESVTGSASTIDVYVAGGQGVATAPSDSGAAGETFYEVDQVQLAWQTADSSPSGGIGDWRMTNWSHLVQDNGPQLATIAAEGYLPFPIGQTDAAPDVGPNTTGNGNR